MSAIWPILGMAGGVYGVRIAGFLLADAAIPPDLERALRFVPIAMLTALFVSTFKTSSEQKARKSSSLAVAPDSIRSRPRDSFQIRACWPSI